MQKDWQERGRGVLRAGQAAGSVLQLSSPFVPAERARQGISPLAVTVEVKRWNRNEQPPLSAKRSIFLPLSTRKYQGNLKVKAGKTTFCKSNPTTPINPMNAASPRLMSSQKVKNRMAKLRALRLRRTRRAKPAAYLQVRRNDEGCSATPQMDFFRSHQD